MSKGTSVRVGDVMSSHLKYIDGMATVSEAMAIMRKEGLRSLVISRHHDGDEYGIVVIADIARGVIARNRSPQRTNVYEVMTKPVLTVDVNMDIKYAIRPLTRFQLSRCLVVNGKDMVGIVTLRDLVLQDKEAWE